MLHVPVEALKFEAIGNKERAKTWRNVHMNVFGLPLQVLHEFHPGITTEMQEWEQHMTLLKEKVEPEKATIQKQLKKVATEWNEARQQWEQWEKAIP